MQLANDKMALKVMEKDIGDIEDIPIVVVTPNDIVSNIKGYYVYKSVWTPRRYFLGKIKIIFILVLNFLFQTIYFYI